MLPETPQTILRPRIHPLGVAIKNRVPPLPIPEESSALNYQYKLDIPTKTNNNNSGIAHINKSMIMAEMSNSNEAIIRTDRSYDT